MKKEELMNGLSEEIRQKLSGCKTAEEAKKVLSEAGVEPLDDELLDAVAGGGELFRVYGKYHISDDGISSGSRSGLASSEFKDSFIPTVK